MVFIIRKKPGTIRNVMTPMIARRICRSEVADSFAANCSTNTRHRIVNGGLGLVAHCRCIASSKRARAPLDVVFFDERRKHGIE